MSLPRVSVAQVTEIVQTSIEDEAILTSMIDTAHVYIDANLLEVGHSEEILSKIELYLSAHFVAISEEKGGMVLDKLGDATQEWDASVMGEGLKATLYGQTALLLDTSGTLANISSVKLRAEFRVV